MQTSVLQRNEPSTGAEAASRATRRITLANGTQFSALAGQTLLEAAQDNGLTLDHSCRVGRCGACKAQVQSGETRTLRPELSILPVEARNGWVLTCAREATTDLSLDIEDIAGPPLASPRTLPCRIDGLERLTPEVMRIRLRLPPNSGFAWQPGQAVDIIGPGGMRRSYSIANQNPADAGVELHVRRVPGGVFSDYWFERAQCNDLLRLHGPLGSFFLRDVAGLDVVLLATGTGYAPIQSLLGQLRRLPAAQRPAGVRLYWGVRQAVDLYATPLQDGDGWQYTPLVSGDEPAWPGARGHVQQRLLADGLAPERSAVYACGSPAMIAAARAALVSHGLPARRFHSDAFVVSGS